MAPAWAWVTAIAWGVQAVVVRGIVRRASPVDIFIAMGVVAGMGAAIVMAVRLLRGRPLWELSLADTGVLTIAEIVGVVGLAAFYFSLKESGLARTAGVSEAYPVLAALLGWAILGEAPTMVQMVGLVVAGVGIALVQQGT